MSKVPSSFPTESSTSQRCGDSWAKAITVTGLVPGTGFGSTITHTIEPVVSYVGNEVGSSEVTADALRDKIQSEIDITRDLLNTGSALLLTPHNVDSIEWLLAHAEAEVASVFQIYDKWRYRAWGSFPLEIMSAADAPFGDCSGKLGETINVGTDTGPNPGFDIVFLCPTVEEMEARPLDRQAIRLRFMDALRHLRCAQFGLWRVRLVSQAMAQLPDPDGPGGFTVAQPAVGTFGEPTGPIGPKGPIGTFGEPTGPKGPKPTVGTFGEPTGPKGEPVGPDPLGLPPTDKLPPPEELDEDDDPLYPEGGVGGEGTGGSAAKAKGTMAYLAIAGAAGLAWLLTKKK